MRRAELNRIDRRPPIILPPASRYDEVGGSALLNAPSTYVDMAGNPSVTSAVHHTCKAHLKYSCVVGNR